MGHFGNFKNEYQGLVKRLNSDVVGLPEPANNEARYGWLQILELFFDPEEARLGAELPLYPVTIETLAVKTGMNQQQLSNILNRMADKGVVMDLIEPENGAVYYSLSPPIVGFFELTMMKIGSEIVSKKTLAEAVGIYCSNSEDFVREVHGHGKTALARAVAYDEATKSDLLPVVYEWERCLDLIKSSKIIAISNCYCRHKAEHLDNVCDAPIETCFSLNKFGEFVVRRNFGRQIDFAEALAILEKCRANNLVHLVDNVKNEPAWVCNCCKCCCGALKAVNNYGLPAINPSRFVPVFYKENCCKCGICTKSCPVNALTLIPIEKKSFTVVVDETKCIGCGICVSVCSKKALKLVERESENSIPYSAIELRILRIIERKRLANFLIDQEKHYNGSLLKIVFNLISTLGQEEQKSALKQVGSRYFAGYLHNLVQEEDKITELSS